MPEPDLAMPDGRIPWLMHDFGGNLEVLPPPPAWQRYAACLGMDPETFVGEGKGWRPGPAIEVCDGCPVRTDCADWAIADGLDHGVFGGKTVNERKAARQDDRHAA